MIERLQRTRVFASRHRGVLIGMGLAFLFFIVECSWINQYGVTWDEPLHRNWGKLFVYYARSGDRRFLELMPGHGIQYGPLYYAVNFALSEVIYKSHLLMFVASNHVLTLFTASIGVFFTYLLALNIGGMRRALLAVLFLVFFPPFIAHAHYNPKDIPIFTAVVITTYLLEIALHRDLRRFFVLAGFFLGISVALKINALLMIPAYVCAYGVALLGRKTAGIRVQRELLTVLFSAIAAIVGVYLAWPSAWTDPMLIPQSIGFFMQSDFWPGKVLFFGTEYSGAELPWFYTPLEYLMSMPVLSVLFLFAGIVVSVRSLRIGTARTNSILLLVWLLFPMLLSMKPGLVRYDGMRQFFFCLPAIAILAALGFEWCIDQLVRFTGKAKPVLIICCGILIASLVHEVWILHPFEGSYRNEVVRRMVGPDLDQKLQIEYWGPSYRQGVEWLAEYAEPNPVICVPTAGVLVGWYPWREDFTFDCSAETDYLMFFTRYSEVKQYALQAMPPVFTIERMHSTLLKIYKIK